VSRIIRKYGCPRLSPLHLSSERAAIKGTVKMEKLFSFVGALVLSSLLFSVTLV
jgi:hypothetical protein